MRFTLRDIFILTACLAIGIGSVTVYDRIPGLFAFLVIVIGLNLSLIGTFALLVAAIWQWRTGRHNQNRQA